APVIKARFVDCAGPSGVFNDCSQLGALSEFFGPVRHRVGLGYEIEEEIVGFQPVQQDSGCGEVGVKAGENAYTPKPSGGGACLGVQISEHLVGRQRRVYTSDKAQAEAMVVSELIDPASLVQV